MAKKTNPDSSGASPSKAQSAFDEYKQRMDEGYQAHLASKGASAPAGNTIYPMYVIGESSPTPDESGGAGMPSSGNPMSSSADTAGNVIDSLAKLLDLSLKTANSTLNGWMKVMDKFYGVSEDTGWQHEHGHYGNYPHGHHHDEPCCCHDEYDDACDCHHDAHHEHDWHGQDCHSTIRNCC